jgi:micrococcal nuclease
MYEYSAKLMGVYDGDTITARLSLGFDLYLEKSIRLLGIDTPELRAGDRKPQAKVAKKWLEDKLTGQKLIIRTCLRHDDGGLDKYGRILGTVTIVGETVTVNDQIIAAGHAVAYDGGAKTKPLG